MNMWNSKCQALIILTYLLIGLHFWLLALLRLANTRGWLRSELPFLAVKRHSSLLIAQPIGYVKYTQPLRPLQCASQTAFAVLPIRRAGGLD